MEIPIQFLSGVGEKRGKLLEKLGIVTVNDAINFFPFRYEDLTNIKNINDLDIDDTTAVCGIVNNDIHTQDIRNGLTLTKFSVTDKTGKIVITFFNREYTLQGIKPGEKYIFYGKVYGGFHSFEMHSPSFVLAGEEPKVIPIYHLTRGISNKVMQMVIKNALAKAEQINDALPHEIRQKYMLCERNFAYRQIHNPSSMYNAGIAQRRLVFDELFNLAIGLKKQKELASVVITKKCERIDLNPLLENIGFELTAAQKRVTKECIDDMLACKQVNRLVQGDVGSGKTIVAVCSAYFAIKNGGQAAMLVPTEILAEQHFKKISSLFEMFGITVEVLTGSTTKKAKETIKKQLVNGEIDFLIGTHAILQADVKFKELSLIVCDEQHRFGVKQREIFNAKAEAPHRLVMSATPIPRTLAQIIYSDLDISIIDELPKGRKKTSTFVINEDKRAGLYKFIKENCENGGQAFVVCPLIEEDELNSYGTNDSLISVKKLFREFEREFEGYKVEIIHGKLKSEEKEKIIKEFSEQAIQILITTTVIEVGIDIPNASIMVVENAERFGLSTLHQLRGRVGRGERESFCFLVWNGGGKEAYDRLMTLRNNFDGFKIAEIDLELRGPGQFLGDRQHGLTELKIANISKDKEVFLMAKEAAESFSRTV